MAGHSKWANIKRRKESQDAKKNQAFSKVSRLIAVSAQKANTGAMGAEEVYFNPSGALSLAIDKAKSVNMPKSNVIKAIEKGLGGGGEDRLSEVVYEGYAPGGVGIMVETVTDNTNRTVAEIRAVFTKFGGSLGESGSVSYIFDKDKNPNFRVKVGENEIDRVEGLLSVLEDHSDTQAVYSNLEV